MFNSPSDVFYQSAGSTALSAAGSWGENIKVGSAGKINNPGVKRMAVLSRLDTPEAGADGEDQD